MNIPLDNIVSASDIQRNYRKVFNRAKRTREPVVIFRGGEPEVAIIDLKTLSELQNKAKEAEITEALEAIRVAEEEDKKGKLKVLHPGQLSKIAGS